MNVTVHYTTQLKAALGVATEVIDLPAAATLSDLIAMLGAKHGESFLQLALTGDGRLVPSIIPCVNNQQVDRNAATPIADCDEVTLLSAISGG